MKTIILSLAISIQISFNLYAQSSSSVKFSNEGITYPDRRIFYSGDFVYPTVDNIPGRMALVDSKGGSQANLIYTEPVVKNSLNKAFTQIVNGLSTTDKTNDPALQVNENVKSAYTHNQIFDLNKNGFTISFWVKFNPVGVPERPIFTITDASNKVIHLELGLLESERRIYLRRQSSYVNKKFPSTSPSDFFTWKLPFWNPEAGDMARSVEAGNDRWYFIMLVYERNQVRLHTGLPNGKFDCMYLNYGLEDQIIPSNPLFRYFRNNNVLFSTSKLYLDDISLWQKPLCRQEAFEFFKDSKGIGTPSFRLTESAESIQTDVVSDDDVRMKTENGRSEGCFGSGNNSNRSLDMNKIDQNLLSLENMNIEIDDEQSINLESTDDNSISVYPNPTNSNINIRIPSLKNINNVSAVQLRLLDLEGKVIRSEEQIILKNQSEISWKIPNSDSILNGLYIIHAEVNGKLYAEKIAINCGCN